MNTKERMITLLPHYLQNGKNINIYYNVLAKMYDDLLNTFLDISDSRNIDTTAMYGLDIIGEIVGEKRNNLKDEKYINNIKIRIMKNNSMGYIENINQIGKAFLGDSYIGIKQGYDRNIKENEPGFVLFQLSGKTMKSDKTKYESRFFKTGDTKVGLNTINKTSGSGISIKNKPLSLPDLSEVVAIGVRIKQEIFNELTNIKIKKNTQKITIPKKITIKQAEPKMNEHSLLQCGTTGTPAEIGILL